MLNSMLAKFYERDIRKLIEEINLFSNEEDLWRTQGSVKNASGNLVLHIVGGLNYLIGATLGQTGYVRDRDQEFIRKDVERKVLVVCVLPLEIAALQKRKNYQTRHLWI